MSDLDASLTGDNLPEVYIKGVNVFTKPAISALTKNDPHFRYHRITNGVYFREILDTNTLIERYGFRIAKLLRPDMILTHSTAWYKYPVNNQIFIGGTYDHTSKFNGGLEIRQSFVANKNGQFFKRLISNPLLFLPLKFRDPLGEFEILCATNELILISMFEGWRRRTKTDGKYLTKEKIKLLVGDLIKKYGDIPSLVSALQRVGEEASMIDACQRATDALFNIRTTSATISELKRNPVELVSNSESPIAILSQKKPAFYCVSTELYERMVEHLSDKELQTLLKSNMWKPAE